MLKATAWSLLGGSVMAAGFAYAYTRRANARRVAGDVSRGSLLGASDDEEPSEALGLLIAESGEAAPGSEDVEIEWVDIDSVEARGEAYDASSPDELGALWLARATQTSGEHTSTSEDDELFEDEDDELDPAGRPTEPPEERRGHDRSR